MCSKKKRSVFQTVTFRLTAWYAGLFGVLSMAVFLVVYVSLAFHLRQQTDDELLNTAREFESLYSSEGVEALRGEFGREAQSRGVERVFFRFLSAGRDVRVASDLGAWDGLEAIHLQTPAAPGGQATFQTTAVSGHRHRVRVISKRTDDDHIIQIGTTLGDNELLMERYRETFGTALVVMLGLGILVGWLAARRAMSGVQRVSRTAGQIGKGDLGKRVPLGDEGQEIDALVDAFNEMLGRIEAAVGELKEVSDNVAHDLRSPITRIRGMAETTLRGGGGVEGYREMAAAVVEESDRLVEMINTMLAIAQADSGVAELARETLDLRGIVEEAKDLFRPVAEDKGVLLQAEGPAEAVFVSGDASKLQRVVANLLDNAIKYTRSGGRVTISVKADGGRAMINVTDTGAGIDKKDLGRVFDRFYRGDESRSTPGSGLGLSLALALVRAHGGDISVTSAPESGSVFSVSLPLSPSVS